MVEIKYLWESFVGFIISSPILEECVRIVSGYDSYLIVWTIIFLALFWIINIVGYILILDGLTRCFFDKNIKEFTEELVIP